MLVCACDPDVRTPAFALFDSGNGPRLLKWHLLRGPTRKWLPDVRSLMELWNPHLLVIENQYLPPTKDGSRHFRSIARLISARAMITGVCLLMEIPYELIEPFAWQKALGGSNLGREQLKKISLIKAADISGEPISNHNIADAINMGYWWICAHRFDDTGEGLAK